MKGKFFISGLMVLLALPLFSCGGGTRGGGADYDTVTLAAALGVGSPFDSDVANHTATSLALHCGDTSIDPDTSEPWDTITFSSDDPNFTITSTPIPGLPAGVFSSNVRLDSVNLTFAPIGASPAIPALDWALGKIIVPRTSVNIPIRIATAPMKSIPPLSDLICGAVAGPYSYNVTVKFSGVEVNTGKARSFTTNFTIDFADWID